MDQSIKIIVYIGFLIGLYFLVQWTIGDLRTKPISEFTLEDVSIIFFAGLIIYFVVGGMIKSINKHD